MHYSKGILFLQSVLNPASEQADRINKLFTAFNYAAAGMLLLVIFCTVNKNDSTIQRGVSLFYVKGCGFCHRINHFGGVKGPDLTYVGNRMSEMQLQIRIVNGGDKMPAYGGILSKDDLNQLVAFLASQR